MGNRIYLIGDTIIDINTYGTPIGLSAETPTITILNKKETVTSGGAAFVYRNFKALNQPVEFLTNDTIKKDRVVKHRFWANGYKLLQVNEGSFEPISKAQEDKIIGMCDPDAGDLVVFSDYRHGLITERLVVSIIAKAKLYNAKVFVDSQVSKFESNHHWYQCADYVFVNEKELECLPNSFFDSARIIVKKGARGAEELYGQKVDGININVIDTCGAGDAFLAAYCTEYLRDKDNALAYANKWAALKCTKEGMETP